MDEVRDTSQDKVDIRFYYDPTALTVYFVREENGVRIYADITGREYASEPFWPREAQKN